MGNSIKCQKCPKKFEKSTTFIEMEVPFRSGRTITVKNHGEYYSIDRFEIWSAVCGSTATGPLEIRIIRALGLGIGYGLGAITSLSGSLYYCKECFLDVGKVVSQEAEEEETKGDQLAKRLAEQVRKEELQRTLDEADRKETEENEEIEAGAAHQQPTDNSEVAHQQPTDYSEVVHQQPTDDSEVVHQQPTDDSEVVHQQPTDDSEVAHEQEALKELDHVGDSLLQGKGKCAPFDYALRASRSKEVPYSSEFFTEHLVQNGSYLHHEGSELSSELALENETTEHSAYDDWNTTDIQQHSVSDEKQNQQRELIVETILAMDALDSAAMDRHWLTSVQTYLLFQYSENAKLNCVQLDMLADALSSAVASLTDVDYFMFTKALASLCSVSHDSDPGFLQSCQANPQRSFFEGLVRGCLEYGFNSSTCTAQCLQMYLQTCEEGRHYDEEILQMITTMVEASLWCVFARVDAAINKQLPVDLRALKRHVHYIQTYQVPLYVVKDAVSRAMELVSLKPFSELQKYKRRSCKSVKTVISHLKELNQLSEEMCDKIEMCVSRTWKNICLKHLYVVGYLTDERKSETQEALKRIPISASPNDIILVLTTLSSAVYKAMKYTPRRTQLVAVCILLLSQEHKINRLLEVLTGEGKSCIIAMFAAALGLQGKKVDIITSSPILAVRDAKKWSKLFETFGQSATHNTEASELFFREGEANRRRRECYKTTIVYGTVGSFSADILREEFEMRNLNIRSKRQKAVAIVDEVDMLMLDEGVQFTYLSHRAAVLRHIEPVLAMVWSAVKTNTPLLTASGSIAFAGVPGYFHNVIFDAIHANLGDTEKIPVCNSLQLVEYLIDKFPSSKCSQAAPAVKIEEIQCTLKQLLGQENPASIKETMESLDRGDILMLIQALKEHLPCHIVAHTLSEDNILKAVTPDKAEGNFLILVANKGIVYPVYTHDELVHGIEAMVLSQCGLANPEESDKETLHSEDGKSYYPGIQVGFDEVLSKWIDATYVLKLVQKTNLGRMYFGLFSNSVGDLAQRAVIELLKLLGKRLQWKFVLYTLNVHNKLVCESEEELTIKSDQSVQSLLVMDNGMLCPLYPVKQTARPPAPPSSNDQPAVKPAQSPDQTPEETFNQLMHTVDGTAFNCGVTGDFHKVAFGCLNSSQVLRLLTYVSNETHEDLQPLLEATDPDSKAAALDTYSTADLLSVLQTLDSHLVCNLETYTLKSGALVHESSSTTTKKGKDGTPLPEVPILVMEKGMLCQLHVNERVEIPKFLKPYVVNQLPTYISSAFTALHMTEKREYLVKDGSIVPVDFQNSGVIEASKKWGGGLQQMLEMKHCLQLSPISVVTNFMSHVEFFQRYTREGALYGLSGTVGHDADTEILKKLYTLEVCRIPTYSHRLRYEREAIIVKGDRSNWLDQVHAVLKDATEPKSYLPGLHGAAALVVCEDIRTANEIEAYLKGRGHKQLILYTRNDSKDKSIEETSKRPGDIIIATNLAGRGTDITVTPEVNASGGLLCLMTYLPRNRRVELQVFGRTGRQGNPGSVQYVLQASALPCDHHNGRVDMTAVRELQAQKEKLRLELMVENDIKQVQVQENLFKMHCKFLESIHREFGGRKDRQVMIDTVNENWGLWLQTKQQEIVSDPEKVLDGLQEVQKRWRPSVNMSPECLPESNFHHLVMFGNQLVRSNRESAARVSKMPVNHLLKLGRQLEFITKEKANAREASRYYTKAIEQESNFTMIAHYNRACCSLCAAEDGCIESGIKDLRMAKELLKVLLGGCTLTLQCATVGNRTDIQGLSENNLLKQMEVRMQVLQFFGNTIEETLEKLQKFQESKEKIEVIPTSILQFIPEADLVTNEELYGLSQLGLEFAFSVRKKPRFCWEGLAVFAFGVAQIAAGVLLMALTTGALSSVGMGLIAEGVSDCIEGVVGMVTGEWDWKEYAISKACSVGVSIACGGVGKFIQKGTKALSALRAGVKAAGTDVKVMTTVAKDSWGTALKVNMKNSVKLAGKELVQLGTMYALSDIQQKAFGQIFKAVGARVARRVQPSLEETFCARTPSEMELGMVVDCLFASELPSGYSSRDEMSPVVREKAKRFFASAADEVVSSLVPSTTALDEVAERFRSLIPQVSSHVKGKASAILGVVEAGFVLQSVEKAESQLESLTMKFQPEMKKHCRSSLQHHKGSDVTIDDSGSELECVQQLKEDLAKHTAEKLGEAIATVLQQNFMWMVNRGLSMTVNKVAASHLEKGLNMEGTKEMIRAGQKANYIRSMSLDTSTQVHDHSIAAMKSHSQEVLKSTNPGTLAELRVAVETFDCKVVEDIHGNKNFSLSSSGKGKKTEVTLVHMPPDGDHPLGNYQLKKPDGSVVNVPSKNNSCMFESFAHGLTEARKGDPSAKEGKIDGEAVRSAVSQNISENPGLWHEHLKRKEELMRMKDGEIFILRGAGPKNPGTELEYDSYTFTTPDLKRPEVSQIRYKQKNKITVTSEMTFDKEPQGIMEKLNKPKLRTEEDIEIIRVNNGAKVEKLVVEVTAANYDTNVGRCAHTDASQNQYQFKRGKRDHGGSAPVSFHLAGPAEPVRLVRPWPDQLSQR